MRKIIFACVHNAGRSQMSAAFFNRYSDPSKARATSAGTQPAQHVHPQVIEVMKELGMDLSGAEPQKLTPALAQEADLLVTMGCGDECPFVPGLKREDWPFPDPKDQSIEQTRQIRDNIERRVLTFIEAENLRQRS